MLREPFAALVKLVIYDAASKGNCKITFRTYEIIKRVLPGSHITQFVSRALSMHLVEILHDECYWAELLDNELGLIIKL